MIDNNHLIYGGVIMVFLIGAMIVVVAGIVLLGVGFAVAMAVRFRKRREGRKRTEAAQAMPADELDELDVFRPVSIQTNPNHHSNGQGGRHWGRRKTGNLPPARNSVSL
jgi:MFS superfamily sulfate permease-like transporter